MKVFLSAALALLASTLASPLSAQSSHDAPVRVHEADNCAWQAELAPTVVRSPVQMDVHAAYRIFVFQSDGTVGYRLRAEFPYAAFLSFTVYNGADALVHSALLDHAIEPDRGSTNPFHAGQLVNAADRSYTVTVLPDGGVADSSMRNPIFMPAPKGRSNIVTAVLVQRIYLAEPNVKDRFGGVDAPVIEPFRIWNPRQTAACPSGDFSAIISQFGSLAGNFSQSPLPRNGKIEFYRPPVATVPYADASGPVTKNDCTGYLMATVHPDRLAVVRLPLVPTFFDNTKTNKNTIFVNRDVRYLSLGSYGATPLSASENENIAGPDVKMLPDGSATFIAVPSRLPSALKQQIGEKAAELGYNVMPLAEAGPVINPFLIYRNKVAKSDFAGDIQNVSCFHGSDFSHAPAIDAASPQNMSQYAPVGLECSVADFLNGACGQDFVASRR